MFIQKLNFPSVLTEAEKTYMLHLEGIVSSVDAQADVIVMRRLEGVSVRISPSAPAYFPIILQMIKKSHRFLGIEVEFSKSMRISSNIFFNINF
jgi:hypothetical protein